jgi:hypothetical protein
MTDEEPKGNFFENELMKKSYSRVCYLHDARLVDDKEWENFNELLNKTNVYEVENLDDCVMENVAQHSCEFSCTTLDDDKTLLRLGAPVIKYKKGRFHTFDIDHELVHVLSLAHVMTRSTDKGNRVGRELDQTLAELIKGYPEMSWPNSGITILNNPAIGNYTIDSDALDKYQSALLLGTLYAKDKKLRESGTNWLCDLIAREQGDQESVELLRKNGYGHFKNTFLKAEERGYPIKELVDTALGFGLTLNELRFIADLPVDQIIAVIEKQLMCHSGKRVN